MDNELYLNILFIIFIKTIVRTELTSRSQQHFKDIINNLIVMIYKGLLWRGPIEDLVCSATHAWIKDAYDENSRMITEPVFFIQPLQLDIPPEWTYLDISFSVYSYFGAKLQETLHFLC